MRARLFKFIYDSIFEGAFSEDGNIYMTLTPLGKLLSGATGISDWRKAQDLSDEARVASAESQEPKGNA